MTKQLDLKPAYPLLPLLSAVYGLPGVSRIISDRDFVIRVARVRFPNGIRVLYCHSISPDEHLDGDPGPTPRMIR